MSSQFTAGSATCLTEVGRDVPFLVFIKLALIVEGLRLVLTGPSWGGLRTELPLHSGNTTSSGDAHALESLARKRLDNTEYGLRRSVRVTVQAQDSIGQRPIPSHEVVA